MTSQDISIRQIQHYLYCPHRWGLMEIDCAWTENYFVTKANLLHKRVHNPEKTHSAYGKKVFTSVSVYNDLPEYNLYGVTDCIEISLKDESDVCIVEYKPSKPKSSDYHFEDLMQVFAQKICVDFVFGCNSKAVIYYADVKKRIALELNKDFEKYDSLLKKILSEMREYLNAGKIPEIQKNQKCSGCSMKDLCLPKLRTQNSTRENIAEIQVNGL